MWAAYNVDDYQAFAERPDMYTKFCQWNRNTAWAAEGSVNDWDMTDDNATYWSAPPCPEGWRLPTQSEFSALHNAGTTWAAANAKGNAVAGRFYGTNHAACSLPDNMANCVFLPAAGARNLIDGTLDNQGSNGYYWGSTQYLSHVGDCLGFNSTDSYPDDGGNMSGGFTLRCVQ